MSVSAFTCPECDSHVKLRTPVTEGKKIRCPKCDAVIRVPVEDDELDEAPRSKARGAPTRKAGRREEDEGRPKKRKRSRDAADEEDDDFEEREKADRRKRKAKKRGFPIVLVSVAAGMLLAIFAVTAFVWPGFLNSGTSGVAGGGNNYDAGDDIGTAVFTDCKTAVAHLPGDAREIYGLDVAALRGDAVMAPSLEWRATREGAGPMNFGAIWNTLRQTTGKEFKEFCDYHLLSYSGFDRRRCVILQLQAPLSAEQFAGRLNAVKKDAQGKTYYEIREGDFATLFMPTDRVVVLLQNKFNPAQVSAVVTVNGKEPTIEADYKAAWQRGQKSHLWQIENMTSRIEITKDKLATVKGNDPRIAYEKPLAEAVVNGNPEAEIKFTVVGSKAITYRESTVFRNEQFVGPAVQAYKRIPVDHLNRTYAWPLGNRIPRGRLSNLSPDMSQEAAKTFKAAAEGRLLTLSCLVPRTTFDQYNR